MKAIVENEDGYYLIRFHNEDGELIDTYVVSDIIMRDFIDDELMRMAEIHEFSLMELIRCILKDTIKNYKKGRRPAYLRRR